MLPLPPLGALKLPILPPPHVLPPAAANTTIVSTALNNATVSQPPLKHTRVRTLSAALTAFEVAVSKVLVTDVESDIKETDAVRRDIKEMNDFFVAIANDFSEKKKKIDEIAFKYEISNGKSMPAFLLKEMQGENPETYVEAVKKLQARMNDIEKDIFGMDSDLQRCAQIDVQIEHKNPVVLLGQKECRKIIDVARNKIKGFIGRIPNDLNSLVAESNRYSEVDVKWEKEKSERINKYQNVTENSTSDEIIRKINIIHGHISYMNTTCKRHIARIEAFAKIRSIDALNVSYSKFCRELEEQAEKFEGIGHKIDEANAFSYGEENRTAPLSKVEENRRLKILKPILQEVVNYDLKFSAFKKRADEHFEHAKRALQQNLNEILERCKKHVERARSFCLNVISYQNNAFRNTNVSKKKLAETVKSINDKLKKDIVDADAAFAQLSALVTRVVENPKLEIDRNSVELLTRQEISIKCIADHCDGYETTLTALCGPLQNKAMPESDTKEIASGTAKPAVASVISNVVTAISTTGVVSRASQPTEVATVMVSTHVTRLSIAIDKPNTAKESITTDAMQDLDREEMKSHLESMQKALNVLSFEREKLERELAYTKEMLVVDKSALEELAGTLEITKESQVRMRSIYMEGVTIFEQIEKGDALLMSFKTACVKRVKQLDSIIKSASTLFLEEFSKVNKAHQALLKEAVNDEQRKMMRRCYAEAYRYDDYVKKMTAFISKAKLVNMSNLDKISTQVEAFKSKLLAFTKDTDIQKASSAASTVLKDVPPLMMVYQKALREILDGAKNTFGSMMENCESNFEGLKKHFKELRSQKEKVDLHVGKVDTTSLNAEINSLNQGFTQASKVRQQSKEHFFTIKEGIQQLRIKADLHLDRINGISLETTSVDDFDMILTDISSVFDELHKLQLLAEEIKKKDAIINGILANVNKFSEKLQKLLVAQAKK